MNNTKFNFLQILFELWCTLVTWFDDSFNHVSKRSNQIILSKSDPLKVQIFIELQKMRRDFQLSDYNDAIWKKKLHAPSYEKVKNLQGLFLWNNNLRRVVLLFRDSKNNLRMACYNRSKGFILSSESSYEIECLLRHKNSYPKLNAREYYFAFSEDL